MSQDITSFGNGYSFSLDRQISMGSLIMWNICKALRTNPHINLQSALQVTQERLLSSANGANLATTQKPEDEYLSCAILAWQRLGHSGTDNLYQFIRTKQEESKKAQSKKQDKAFNNKKSRFNPGSFISYNPTIGSTSYDTVGPVVKLPAETTRIVMRLENASSPRKVQKTSEKDIMEKIEAVCCMESVCTDKLVKLDKATSDLRTRAQRLAQSEAQRVELLERAEAAWRDLEMGYHRRLAAAREKEEDITKHIHKLIEERNSYKEACSILAKQLRGKSETAEKERMKLINAEKEIYDSACIRLKFSEDVARLDAELAELQCKSTQLDRENQFKEEQTRVKLQNMESEIDCTRILTCETERTMRAELGALRDQINTISKQLLEEDSLNTALKEELSLLRQEKNEIVEDLEACQVLCNNQMQATFDELNAKRQKLRELKDTVTECQCHLPVDVAVEVKRTPSLAAMCLCQPEDRFSETCSCTSLRTTLLTNLLCDLFGGLQSQMGGGGSEMPCQLLKCLEDKHNWDKSSQIKTNLRNYFSKLLIGELDIAIATSIEKYHAKWVGHSCVDAARPTSAVCSADGNDWQERAVERRAQKLACKLAEELFQQRADQLTEKAREVLRTGPPPCECMPRSAAVYPVLVKPACLSIANPSAIHNKITPMYWQQTHQDVSQLRTHLEDLKKASIRKEDLKIMEDNIVKLVQLSVAEKHIDLNTTHKEANKKNGKIMPSGHRSNTKLKAPSRKLIMKKKESDKGNKNVAVDLQKQKPCKPLKRHEQSYAVNVCLCKSQKAIKKEWNQKTLPEKTEQNYYIPQNDTTSLKPTVNHTKPIEANSPTSKINNTKQNKALRLRCHSDLACFHKSPSNTSIQKLLETLAKWNNNNNDKEINVNECVNIENVDKSDKPYTENQSTLKNNIKSKFVIKSQDVSTKMSIDRTNYVSKQTDVDITNSTEGHCDLPITTNSEYVGAINLEKSNEFYCKCVGFQKGQEDVKFPYNCINFEKCDFKTNHKTNESTKLNETEKLHSDNLNCVSQQKQLSGESENVIVTTSSSLATDCKYCIKFLGVTLTNAKSIKHNNDDEQKILNVQQITTRNNVHKKSDTTHNSNENSVKSYEDVNNNPNKLMTQTTKTAPCVRSKKYNEFKILLNGVFSKQCEYFNKNEDKSLNTSSLSNTIKPDNCVCCNNIMRSDESNDLEVNAFSLLEHHLKEKLEEFKNSTCKSSCISSDVEKKIFSNILERVKLIILDGAGNVGCKCSHEESFDGSWHRAYNLLQEYLKIKIRRVQCSCMPVDENKILLPEIMDKICKLIDNDFQRLKEICKCNRRSGISNTITGIELPEKDNNKSQNGDNTMYTLNKNKNSHMSSQVSYNFGMDTRSCDVMEREIKNRSVNCSLHKCCYDLDPAKCYHLTSGNNNKYEYCSKPDMTVNHSHILCKDDFDTTLVNSLNYKNRTFNEMENKDRESKLPYIGYTFNCTCNRAIGSCTCAKSMVTRNSSNINVIWNTLTNSKLRSSNVSYIMDSVLKAPTDTENNIKNIAVNGNNSDKSMRDTEISVHNDENFILKDSRANLSKIYIPATTSAGNIDFTINKQCYDYNGSQSKLHDFSRRTCEGTLYYPLNSLKNRGQSEIFAQSQYPLNVTGSLSSNCTCNMVPLCHVKLLVENIENKLFHSQCTCDSLCSKVCPVHSKNKV